VLGGILGPDDLSLTGTPTGQLPIKNIGVSKVVSISGVALAGGDAGNYALVPITASASISPAPLTVTGLAAQDKLYDSTVSATLTGSPGLAGLFGGDDVSLIGSASGVFANPNVGTAKVVSITGLSITGLDAGNYLLVHCRLTATISPASLTVTGLAAQSRIYDGLIGAVITGTPALSGVIGSDAFR